MLTTYADDESILSALRAGARGYLTKDAGRRRDRAAPSRAAAAGQSVLDPARPGTRSLAGDARHRRGPRRSPTA